MEECVGIDFYSNVKTLDVQWIWYPYIPCGKITLLQGDPGEGKSTFILHIVAILTKAGILPDGVKIKEPSTVIYQCSEDGISDTIKPRLLKAGADCNRVAFIKEDDKTLTLDDKRIEDAIRCTNARLLILDPIQAFIEQDGDMQSAVKMRKVMRKLADIAASYNCGIVLVGHMNKSGSNKKLYRGLGSIDIAATARSVLMISRDKEEPKRRYMFQIKSSLAVEGEPIGFEFDKEKGFQWIGKCQVNIQDLMVNERASADKKDMAIQLLHTMLSEKDMPSVQIFEIMNGFGISKRTVQEAKKESGIQAYKKHKTWYWRIEVGDSI